MQQQLEGASRFIREWQSYLVDKAAGNTMQAANDLRNLANSCDTRNVKTVLDHARQVVLTSSDPKAFDALLVEIGAVIYENRVGQFTPSHLAVGAQLTDADRFLKDWQSYLLDKQAGNTGQAANDLRHIATFTDTFRPVARSRLLEMANDPSLGPEAAK